MYRAVTNLIIALNYVLTRLLKTGENVERRLFWVVLRRLEVQQKGRRAALEKQQREEWLDFNFKWCPLTRDYHKAVEDILDKHS